MTPKDPQIWKLRIQSKNIATKMASRRSLIKKKNKEKHHKIFQKSNQNPDPNITLQNGFASLQNQPTEKKGNNTAINTKPQAPPPIVIIHQKIIDYKEVIKLITDLIGKQFHLKHTTGRTSVQTYSTHAYKILLKELTENKIHLHAQGGKNTWIRTKRAGFRTHH